MFEVKPRNSATAGNCKSSGEIYNLNVRGKRGNIVQVYPSVEYDFAPNTLVVKENDCVHVQWTGSDYNPNRNPNNGEGGPPDPQNDGQARADRSNIVQMSSATNNYPEFESEKYGMFDATPQEWSRLAFLDQPYQISDICATPNGLQNLANNRQARDRHYKNCMKLNGADTPYFNGGVMTPGKKGSYKYMSTRNNNFSNRGQKGHLIVEAGRSAGGTAVSSLESSQASVSLALRLSKDTKSTVLASLRATTTRRS